MHFYEVYCLLGIELSKWTDSQSSYCGRPLSTPILTSQKFVAGTGQVFNNSCLQFVTSLGVPMPNLFEQAAISTEHVTSLAAVSWGTPDFVGNLCPRS